MKGKVIENYKGLTPFEIPDLPSFVVLTGKNGSGKSQFLELLNIKLSDTQNNNEFHKQSSKCMELEENYPKNPQITHFGQIRVGVGIFNSYQAIHEYEKKLQEIKSNPDILNHDQNRDHIQSSLLEMSRHFQINISELTKEHILEYICFVQPSQSNNILHSRIASIIGGYFESEEENRRKHFEEKEYGEDFKYLTKEEFDREYPNPFDLINESLRISEVGYQLKKITLSEYRKTRIYTPVFLNLHQKEVPIQNFSSGEKTLFCIALSMFNMKGKYQLKKFPDLLLFDEIDAGLHPSMIKNVINLIEKYFNPKGIQVILTTHSPSTVALAPNSSIYCMTKNNGQTQIKKANQIDAIRDLLDGVRSIDVNPKRTKYVFTESESDKYFYSKIFEYLREDIDSDVHIQFIESSRKDKKISTEVNGGSGQVQSIVQKLRDAGNSNIFGIIDWDLKNQSSDGIFVHLENEIYTLENVILNPYFLGLLLLHENLLDIKKIFPSKDRRWIDIFLNHKNNTKELSENLNILSKYVEDKVIESDIGEIKKIQLINGIEIQISQKYCTWNGHELENLIKDKFQGLKKYHNKGQLMREIVNKIIKNFFYFLPINSLKMLKKIQNT